MTFQITPLVAATISAWIEYETGYIAGKSGLKIGDTPEIKDGNHKHLTGLIPRISGQNINLNGLISNFQIVAFCDDTSTGYLGVILINHDSKQIVLVHRPTNFKLSLTDNLLERSGLQQDIDGIFKCTPLKHEEVAFRFCKNSFIPLCMNEEYSGYSLNITGHSLASWLAQMSALFCHLDGIDSLQTITFDGPGAKEAISRYAPEGFNSSTLSIINFLSQPNLVNAAGNHVGDTRALPTFIPPIKEYSSYCRHAVESKMDMGHATRYGHDFESILPCFDLNTGFPKEYLKVVKWPCIKYLGKKAPVDTKESSTAGSITKVIFDLAIGRVDYGELAEYYKHVDSGVTTNIRSTSVDFRIFHAAHYQTQKPSSKIERVTENTILRYLQDLGLKSKENLKGFELVLASQFEVQKDISGVYIKAIGDADIEKIIDKAFQLCREHHMLTSYYKDTPFVHGYYQQYRGPEMNYDKLKEAARLASDDESPYKNKGILCCNSPFDIKHALEIVEGPLSLFLRGIYTNNGEKSTKVAVVQAMRLYEHKEGWYFKELFINIASIANNLLHQSSQEDVHTNEPIDGQGAATNHVLGDVTCMTSDS